MATPAEELRATAETRKCAVCGLPRPANRRLYCEEKCAIEARQSKEREKGAKRRGACHRCQGPKEYGTRGGKYCNACRQDLAPTWQQLEKERSRQRRMRELDAKQDQRRSRRTIDCPEGQKWCAHGQHFQPIARFNVSNERTVAYCKPCQKAYNHARMIKQKFGVTAEQYMAIYEAQGSVCAICHRKPRSQKLAVDHDHKTGEIRGLLCYRCNHRLLGAANDSVEILQRAVDYLTNPPAAGYGQPLETLEAVTV